MADHRSNHLPERLDDATLGRYLSGTCEPAELARVERWLSADPAHRAELAGLRMAWNPAPLPEADPDDQMWRWIAARMDTPVPQPTVVRPLPRPAGSSRGHLRWLGLAAAALVLTIAGAGALWHSGRALQPGFTIAETRELVAPRGARVTGNLPDGSRVILGPETRLRIPATFASLPSAGGARDVYLDGGEAFFEVKHDSTWPFRVHTRHGIVQDLGTEFVVTAYPELGTTRVAVASGVVALRGRAIRMNGEVTLNAGDVGQLEPAGAKVLQRHVDITPYVGWTTGALAFDAVPVRDVITRLGRWYDVDLRLADSLMAERRISVTFHDEPMLQVLRALETILNARVEQVGQRVVLWPR